MTTNLPTRTLGKSGLSGTALGFGCMSLSPGFYSSDVDTNETAKTLRRALELGATFLSTADFYSGFKPDDKLHSNLSVIGGVLREYPQFKPVIAMKWGPWVEPGKGFQPVGLGPEDCRKRVEDSLKVLGVPSIDVLIWRLVKPPKESVEEIAKGMKALVDEGKVKAIGVSEVPAADIRKIHKIVPVSVIELECSLFSRDCFEELVPLGREIGASFLAYSPLGRGLLADNFDVNSLPDDDFRKQHQSRFSEENLTNNQKLALRVKELAAKKGCTSGQLAIAWVLAQGEDFIPIPGTKQIKNVEANFEALKVKLSPEEIKELTSIIPADEVSGARY